MSRLAGSIGYFQTGVAGKHPDMPATVRATTERGGMPTMVYQIPKKLCSLVILEDGLTEALSWNTIPRELVAGMQKHAVPVLHGTFWGSPEQFTTDTGRSLYLDDLDAERGGYLVLVFSDGKGLYHRPRVLESLARWPHIAWLDPRAREFWDEVSAVFLQHGIPRYPGTARGVIEAIDRFTSERAKREYRADEGPDRHDLPNRRGMSLPAYLEAILGDALPWAQACAMLQPITLGAADALRRRFHPNLPPERLDRLIALPGTTRNVIGLHFSNQVLAVLRQGFCIRRTERQQEAVLRFLLTMLEASKPEDSESPAYLAWEWKRERLHLELDPDKALARLAALAQTPLGNAIKADLVRTTGDGSRVPLRKQPKHIQGRQRLGTLIGNPLVRIPLTSGQRLALASLCLAFLVSAVWSALELKDRGTTIEGVLSLEKQSTHEAFARIEVSENNQWVRMTEQLLPLSIDHSSFPGSYRFTVYAGGQTRVFGLDLTGPVTLEVREGQAREPCRVDYPHLGLTLFRCPPQDEDREILQKTWLDAMGGNPSGRLSSIGLMIGEDDPMVLHEASRPLWEGKSIDMLYVLSPGAPSLEDSMRQISKDVGPWLERAQFFSDSLIPLQIFRFSENALALIPREDLTDYLAHNLKRDTNGNLYLEAARGSSPVHVPDDMHRIIVAHLEKLYQQALIERKKASIEALLERFGELGMDIQTYEQQASQLDLTAEDQLQDPVVNVEQKLEPQKEPRADPAENAREPVRDAMAEDQGQAGRTLTIAQEEANAIAAMIVNSEDKTKTGGLKSGLLNQFPITIPIVEAQIIAETQPIVRRFELAQADNDLSSMQESFDAYARHWPDDAILDSWKQAIDTLKESRLAKRQDFNDALTVLEFNWARESITFLEELGDSVDDETKSLEAMEARLKALDKDIENKLPEEIFQLAWDHLIDKGKVIQNRESGLYFMKKAEEQGDSRAIFFIYAHYAMNSGVTKAEEKAVAWFRQKAGVEKPSEIRTLAQAVLGILSMEGRVIPRNDREAFRLLSQTDVSKHPAVIPLVWTRLGILHREGRGTEKAPEKAVKWFRKAANYGDGDEEAQYQLGMMYLLGEGVKPNLKAGLKWLRKAARAGHEQARKELDKRKIFN